MSVNSGDGKQAVTPDSLSALSTTTKPSAPTEQDSQQRGIDASGRRIDGPHTTPNLIGDESTSTSDSDQQILEPDSDSIEFGEIQPVGRDVETPVSDWSGQQDEMLLQASQITNHLRQQFDELNRREQSMNSQLVQLDRDRRGLRLWAQEFEEDAKERDDKLRAQEQQIARQLDDAARRSAQMDEREADLSKQFNELSLERERMHEELVAALKEERDLLEADKSRVSVEAERLEADRRNFDVLSEQQQQDLTERREYLELEFNSRCEQMRAEITTEALTEELRSEREQFETASATWEEQKAADVAEIEGIKQRQEEAIVRSLDEIAELRQTYRAEIDEWKTAQEERLVQERERFEAECSERELNMRQEQAIFENRLRFQQEHLAKAQADFETAQNEFRLESQQTRLRSQQDLEQLRLRTSQVNAIRAILENREASVDRQHELLAKSQLAFEQWVEDERKRLESERSAWDHERQSQKAEIQRQQDIMSLHAENLESRRTRLDQLRAELEETHRNTLEMRMALEEAWAQFCQATGDDAARVRVDVARQALTDHYRNLRESLELERSELDESKSTFAEQRSNFRQEQQTLTDWIAERDDRLREREAELSHESLAIEARELEWRAAHDKWQREKLEAESVIRDLLQQLSGKVDDSLPEETPQEDA